MCDADTVHGKGQGETMGRREFAVLGTGTVAAAAFAASLWPASAAAMDALSRRDVTITTSAGSVDAYFTAPSSGKHPAVLIWPDIRGLRPTFTAMADRLAAEGYAVLCVNPFYRWQAGPAMVEGEAFSDATVRERLFGWMHALTRPLIDADTRDFIAFLDGQDAVDSSRKMAVTGYCMGGAMAIYSAAALPDRVGAVASFHGGGVGTDKADSPHLLIGGTKAAYLFAIAQDDDAKEPQEKVRLNDALKPRPQWHEVEVYPANHGWCPPDGFAYDEVQAEKAWGRMLAMMAAAL
ncbi:dienelactone hydrolase family protein [Sphingopyxis yananensis]|uniref:dienelactone hydrolase family protein n=1 Tax=Sphingopyxis yananensis TaxID=2886687 RepID=UPI001D10EF2C|nr:dienelactone hydrolase family protein [Sphingopyxis yananensis]MCC2602282.1 dienelactone hydrolase family protein [Sphingopyxis yananensis]